MTTSEGEPNWRRRLEADAQAGRRAQEELAQLREQQKITSRELAFRRAGVDPTSAGGKLLFKAYDGELDPEQIREQAAQVGALHDPYGASRAAMERVSFAQAGGTPSGGYVPDFNAELDSIPLVVDGVYNPDYINQVLAKTQVQAAREGRKFDLSGGQVTWQHGAAGPVPVTSPLE